MILSCLYGAGVVAFLSRLLAVRCAIYYEAETGIFLFGISLIKYSLANTTTSSVIVIANYLWSLHFFLFTWLLLLLLELWCSGSTSSTRVLLVVVVGV